MRNGYVSSLLFATLACFSLATFATTPAKVDPAQPAVTQPAKAPEVGMVNLNTADAAALERELDGIGQVKAKAIVDHREANGPFTSVDELLEVKGIGAATLEKNRAKLSVH
ncbi:ComEA family DNA-binding protein [Pseudomonas sp. GV071]|jgi:competence protein ComEA|uniref:ComEA family DNA-binding protein n=1 Tax=Pseudomonas sp. GV071 TaxID=2135754 RepID=UPI000D346327|nr:ComEA family DNA-binding protein [Pseudomonas sp. GV071]PTQ68448.1 competence protein ComEA [Pseudomonas sp. GV071]